MELLIYANAKLNITLDVVGKLNDGYHAVKMVMESVALCDDITIRIGEGNGVTARSNLPYLPADRRNIAVRAAELFMEETGIRKSVSLRIVKRIPVCAGMAGGSADAAAVLRGLDRLFRTNLGRAGLERLGSLLGSDVPYCVAGGTALAEGRGERLTPLSKLSPCHVVICKPDFSISTPDLFSKLDCERIRNRPDTQGVLDALTRQDLSGVARRMYNVFEDVLTRGRSEVEAIKAKLLDHGALGAAMSGTGPTVFGLYQDRPSAAAAAAALREHYTEVFLTKNIPALEV